MDRNLVSWLSCLNSFKGYLFTLMRYDGEGYIEFSLLLVERRQGRVDGWMEKKTEKGS